METEIKLQANPEDLDAVVRTVQRIAAVDGAAQTKRLESRYYDTKARELAARQIALRVRRTGDGFIQTIKTNGGSGVLFSRGETEKPVESFQPAVTGEELGIAEADLEEVYITDIERRKLNACYPPGRPEGTLIELAVDVGEIRANGRRQPVCEVELELLHGEAADLFDMGARLAEQVPLQLSVDSKSARAQRLSSREAPEAVKAGKLEFSPDVVLEEGMRESLRACVQQWFANQAAAFDGRDIEGVHQMRVALRRLRSALTFFKDFIPDPPLGEFKEESRRTASGLGAARDWDVFLTETLQPLLDMWPEHRGLRTLREIAQAMREDGYKEARLMISSPSYTVFALRLAGWIERSGWRAGASGAGEAHLERPMAEHAGALLDRLYEKVMRRGRDFEGLEIEEKHELRIALKKLRYAGEFFRSLYPKKDVKRFRDSLTALLELLGKLNDLSVAQDLCGKLMDAAGDDSELAEEGVASLLDWHEQRGHVSDKVLSRAWREFAAAEPFWRD